MVKTYQGEDMQGILRQVKEELGPDAEIAQQRRLPGNAGYEVIVRRTRAVRAPEPELPLSGEETPAAPVPAPPADRTAAHGAARQQLTEMLRRRQPGQAFAPKQPVVTRPDQRVIDLIADDRVLPPVAGVEPPPTRSITYGAGGRPAGAKAQTGIIPGTVAPTEPPPLPVAAPPRPAGPMAERSAAAPVAPAAGQMELTERLLAFLAEQDVTPHLAREICHALHGTLPTGQQHDCELVRTRLREVLEQGLRGLRAAEPLARACCALVLIGPPGEGKTTTAVKLAARFRVNGFKEVAIIDHDAGGWGGGAKLRRGSEALRIPYVPVTTGSLAAAWQDLRAHDVVIIDTAGCPPKEAERLAELRLALDALDGITQTRLLVMSATGKARDLQRAAESYRAVRYDHFVFTKLDQTSSLGNMYGLLRRTGVPALYVATGQEVSGHLDLLCPQKLVRGLCRDLPRW